MDNSSRACLVLAGRLGMYAHLEYTALYRILELYNKKKLAVWRPITPSRPGEIVKLLSRIVKGLSPGLVVLGEVDNPANNQVNKQPIDMQVGILDGGRRLDVLSKVYYPEFRGDGWQPIYFDLHANRFTTKYTSNVCLPVEDLIDSMKAFPWRYKLQAALKSHATWTNKDHLGRFDYASSQLCGCNIPVLKVLLASEDTYVKGVDRVIREVRGVIK